MLKSDAGAVKQMMQKFYASPAVMTNGSEEIFDADIEACVSKSPFLEGFIFDDGKTPVGYAMLAHSFSTEFGKPCVWIEDIYIEPEYRGNGAATAFFEHLNQRFKGFVLRLEAERDNGPAIRLYERCGFEELPYFEMIKHQ